MNPHKKNMQVFTHTPINTHRNSYVVPSCRMRPTRKYVTTSKNDQVSVCKKQMSCWQMPWNIVLGSYVMNLNNQKYNLEISKPSLGVGPDCRFERQLGPSPIEDFCFRHCVNLRFSKPSLAACGTHMQLPNFKKTASDTLNVMYQKIQSCEM